MKSIRKRIKNIIWRLQFKKVKAPKEDRGRCVNCDAGNPIIQCADYYCPCKHDEHLKNVRNPKKIIKRTIGIIMMIAPFVILSLVVSIITTLSIIAVMAVFSLIPFGIMLLTDEET